MALIALMGSLVIAGSAGASPVNDPRGPTNQIQEQHAPVSSAERLFRLDQLRADLEEAKLRAQIAKANADAKPTSAGSTMSFPAGMSTPPLPVPGGNTSSFGLIPPLPSSDSAARSKVALDSTPMAPAVEVVEAYGVGKARQAIINVGGTKRIIRVGDHLMGGVVVSIAPGAVSVRNSRGRFKTYE